MPVAWRADRPGERPPPRPSSACRRCRPCAAGHRTRPGSRTNPPALRRQTGRTAERRSRAPASPIACLALAHILAHRGLADDNLRHLLPQPHPDAMRRMPLLARRLAVGLQNRVDKRQRRCQLGPLPLGFFRSGGRALAKAWRTSRRCTPNFRATARIVPAPCSYSRRICSYSSTLLLLVAKPSSFPGEIPRNKITGSAFRWGQIRPSKGANSE